MRFSVKVHANSSQEKVIQISEKEFEVWIKQKPIEDKANKFLEKFLKDYFKGKVKIVSGLASKNKIIEVENEI